MIAKIKSRVCWRKQWINSSRNFRKLHEHFKILNNKIKDFKQKSKRQSDRTYVNCAVRLNKQAWAYSKYRKLVSINTENERTIVLLYALLVSSEQQTSRSLSISWLSATKDERQYNTTHLYIISSLAQRRVRPARVGAC